MSQASSGFTPAAQVPHASSKDPFGSAYIPNEEERRVFRECNSESFWYRSLPFSAIAMGVTQVLVSRGKLTPSPRFGSLPKVVSLPFSAIAMGVTQVLVSRGKLTPSPRFGSLPKVVFAGICGYIGGKMSYMRVCQEKFRKLENSPLGEALRQGRLPNIASVTNQSEFSELNTSESEQSGFESVSQPATEVSSMPESYSSYTSDYTYSSPSQSYDPTPFSSGFSDSGPVNSSQAPFYPDEDVPKKKPVLYEELRSKNRENYEVTLTQKAETLLKPQREVATPKEVKKNQYGDAWDE